MPAKAPRIRNAFETFVPDQEPGRELEGARQLPLTLLEPNPHQARQVFDESKLAELTASVQEHGVLEPILVRPLGDRYQIVAGERRYRAAIRADLAEIPAIIREDLSDVAAAFITATENLQRADLDLEDEARQFAYLVEQTGLSHRKLAEQLGIHHDYITRRIALLPHPRLLAAVRAGECTQQAALRLLARPALLRAVDAGELEIGAAVAQLKQDAATDETLLEREELTHGASSTRLRPEFKSFRWRWADTIDRGLRRIAQAPLGEDELRALDHYLETWQATLDQIRAGRAERGGEPDVAPDAKGGKRPVPRGKNGARVTGGAPGQ
ncbi:MAG TPA: ParB/RepB/Spo0J family partition protein [Chloroflexia bacterium]|nr:ParB/RepB/Spo0J family partition protein [Chloroflexia bacterium]